MPDPKPPTKPVPSATLLLLRDGATGLEVLMLERHGEIDFVPGAMVFPGGKLDEADADPALRAHLPGAEVLDDEAVALRAAAIREAFEECGVLLARPRGESALVDRERLRALSGRYRDALHAGRTPLRGMLEAEDLELAADLLVPFAHWVTPVVVPRRFDTHFFAVAAPPDHGAAHDGNESVASTWISPKQALAEESAGRLTIIFPTLQNLRRLAASDSVAEALTAARKTPVVTVLPKVEKRPSGLVVTIPADAGYDVVEASVEALQPVRLGTRPRSEGAS